MFDRLKAVPFIALALCSVATMAEAQFKSTASARAVRNFPIAMNGALWIDDSNGSVSVTGADRSDILIEATTIVRAADDDALAVAKTQAQLFFAGDQTKRVAKAVIPEANNRWVISVNYVIQVPRTISLNIVGGTDDKVQVSNVFGPLFVRTVGGTIELHDALGGLDIDSANANIFVYYSNPPRVPSKIASLNGSIELHVPQNGGVAWLADTLNGDILSAIDVPGRFVPRVNGHVYRGSVGSGGPLIQTRTITGRIYLLPKENPRAIPRSLIPPTEQQQSGPEDVRLVLERWRAVFLQPPTDPTGSVYVAHSRFNGDFEFDTNNGNVFIGQVDGAAKVTTGAGEIALGRVLGTCNVRSLGGPLNLGEVAGQLSARTSAGDILVRAARRGGTVQTEGGSIYVLYSGGPMTLDSGGGDVTLRQAMAGVKATTKSGDISIAVDAGARSATVDARTVGGSIFLNLPPGFPATIDATILTRDDNMHSIQSDMPGLTILKDKVGNMTRIRAQGKINGGGDKMTLHVENGNIRIRKPGLR
ncbi:MAG TPA: hypothetical protein VHL58_15220 [Thermoanaerobaculia bacterium]|nr:hypothetical protein [Thermoanaerobaculia bacterium]